MPGQKSELVCALLHPSFTINQRQNCSCQLHLFCCGSHESVGAVHAQSRAPKLLGRLCVTAIDDQYVQKRLVCLRYSRTRDRQSRSSHENSLSTRNCGYAATYT